MSATTTATTFDVTKALAWRSLLLIPRVPSAFIPSLLFPLFLLISFTGGFSALVDLPGFPADEMLNWMLPMTIVQGACFGALSVGLGAARDLEGGFFDRLLAAPAPRAGLVTGPMLAAMARALLPMPLILAAAFLFGADLPGGVLGLVTLVIAAEGAALCAAAWALAIALRFRSQRAAPLMNIGIFLTVFMSTAQVPQELMTGWLKVVARYNPMTRVLALARQGFLGDVSWAATWPGLVAILGVAILLTSFAMSQLRRVIP